MEKPLNSVKPILIKIFPDNSEIPIITCKSNQNHYYHTQSYPDNRSFIQNNYEQEDTENQTDYDHEQKDEQP